MATVDDLTLPLLAVAGAALLAFLLTLPAVRRSPLGWLPLPATLLVIGVGVNAASSRLHHAVNIDLLAQVGTIGLVLVLFEGGFSGGWRRMRSSLVPVLVLGLAGTLLTTALLGVLIHFALGMSGDVSLLVAVALGPTDPAAVFSILGNQDVEGRSGVILEGESGANDPVGIALMIAALAYVQGDGSIGAGVAFVALALVVGSAVGAAVGCTAAMLLACARRSTPPTSLFPLAALGAAFLAFAGAELLHGSGFLAVLVAGLVMGDRLGDHAATGSVVALAAALGEVATFTLLGLVVNLGDAANALVLGLATFALLALVARPLVVLPLLAPTDLTHAERGFIAWTGLKGAVPALLAAFVVLDQVPDARRIFAIVFVAVAASIVIQGGSIPWLVRRLGLAAAPANAPD